jgi:hypothetical protein
MGNIRRKAQVSDCHIQFMWKQDMLWHVSYLSSADIFLRLVVISGEFLTIHTYDRNCFSKETHSQLCEYQISKSSETKTLYVDVFRTPNNLKQTKQRLAKQNNKLNWVLQPRLAKDNLMRNILTHKLIYTLREMQNLKFRAQLKLTI